MKVRCLRVRGGKCCLISILEYQRPSVSTHVLPTYPPQACVDGMCNNAIVDCFNERKIMNNNMKLETMLIWKGLLDCDRETLSIFIALFEDSKGSSLLSDKVFDVKEKAKKVYERAFFKEERGYLQNDIKDHFSRRIERTAYQIGESALSDDDLKVALWEHILNALQLSRDGFMSPRDVKRHCDDIANKMIQNVSLQQRREAENVVQKLNPFWKTKSSYVSFEEAAEHLISKITKEAVHQDRKIVTDIEQKISKLDEKIIKQSGVANLTEDAISRTLVTSGSLLGLMGGVQAAGFSAYIMAAQASAIIPLVGGKTLVSLLFVVTNPFFVIPAICATGAISNNSLEKSIKQSFAIIISTMLVMRGMVKKEQIFETESFLSRYKGHLAAVSDGAVLTSFYKNKELKTVTMCAEESVPNISEADIDLLLSKVEIKKEGGGAILTIYPTSNQNIDNTAIAGLTFADFIYDVAAIDPHVIEATDFARKAEISDVFEFSIFSESLGDLSGASLRGHHSNLMGYTAERIVASQLVEDGHVVEMPDSASQPGYDLLVDGNAFQVKCVEPSNLSILERHFDKYPDTPVFVNTEVAEVIADKAPEWSSLVFYVGGYSHEKASGLLTQAIDAGQELNNYEILSSVAVVSALRNAIDWGKGVQSFSSATFNVTLDSVSKGGMAIAGGVAGSGLGMLLFGPAGAYILGGVSSVFGAVQGNVVTNQIDKFLDPEREKRFRKLANGLLEACNKELESKIVLLDQKMSMLSDSGVASYVRYRFTWEKLSLQVAIERHESLIRNKSINGAKKIFKAIKLASESTVHPYCLQQEYVEIANALNQKVDRIGKAGSLMKGFIK